ncbi:transmembrane protein, partial [Cystoisospora suis]
MSLEDARLFFATLDFDGQGFVTRDQFLCSLEDLHRDIWRYRAANELNRQILRRVHLLVAFVTVPAACIVALLLLQTFLTFCIAASLAVVVFAALAFAAPRVYRTAAVWNFLSLRHPFSLGDFVELALPARCNSPSVGILRRARTAEATPLETGVVSGLGGAAAFTAPASSAAAPRWWLHLGDVDGLGIGPYEASPGVVRGRCVRIDLQEIVIRQVDGSGEALRLSPADVARCSVRNFSQSVGAARVLLDLLILDGKTQDDVARTMRRLR